MAERYTIREYDGFTRGGHAGSGYFTLKGKTFDDLEKFILANRTDTGAEPLELMAISARKGIGKVISAKNYVGLITMNDGTEIEILPKIYMADMYDEATTKRIFLEMLKTVKEIPYKTFCVSNIHTEKMSIFEVFIRMFTDEVFTLLKQGIRAGYVMYESNEHFLKGKLLFSEHMKQNLAHKERFFVGYDVYDVNRPENRLIKSTIAFLASRSNSTKNKKDLYTLLAMFDSVDFSTDYIMDFSRCTGDRTMAAYSHALKWCRVFLTNRSFTAFAGSEVAYALLFPMETVFESYVAQQLRRSFNTQSYQIRTQDHKHWLFTEPHRKFALIPDIVVENSIQRRIVVMDTKWKLLSTAWHNYGIAQSDMYQMYAYGKKYGAEEVLLLYPLCQGVKGINDNIIFRSEDGVAVRVLFIDLLNMDNSVQRIIDIVST